MEQEFKNYSDNFSLSQWGLYRSHELSDLKDGEGFRLRRYYILKARNIKEPVHYVPFIYRNTKVEIEK